MEFTEHLLYTRSILQVTLIFETNNTYIQEFTDERIEAQMYEVTYLRPHSWKTVD